MKRAVAGSFAPNETAFRREAADPPKGSGSRLSSMSGQDRVCLLRSRRHARSKVREALCATTQELRGDCLAPAHDNRPVPISATIPAVPSDRVYAPRSLALFLMKRALAPFVDPSTSFSLFPQSIRLSAYKKSDTSCLAQGNNTNSPSPRSFGCNDSPRIRRDRQRRTSLLLSSILFSGCLETKN